MLLSQHICPVLQRAFQMMQKLMALDQEEVIDFKGTALHNFLPQSLKWEISFMNLILSCKDADIEELHTAISDYDIKCQFTKSPRRKALSDSALLPSQ